MKNEEVIKRLSALIVDGNGTEEIALLEEDIEALNIAIKILEQRSIV